VIAGADKCHVGFYRTEHRAGLINASVKAAGMFKPTTASFLRLTVQLTTLLAPIKALDYLHVDDTNPDAHDPAYTAQLMHLVGLAQQLNHAIRRNGDVVYYFEPVYKDEEFEPSSMKCHNLASMQAECPLWVLGADGGERLPNDPLGDETDVALVRVVCSPGCVAYRKGGGDLGKRLLREDATRPDYSVPPELRKKGGGSAKNVVFGRVLTEKDGFRSKRIARVCVVVDGSAEGQSRGRLYADVCCVLGRRGAPLGQAAVPGGTQVPQELCRVEGCCAG